MYKNYTKKSNSLNIYQGNDFYAEIDLGDYVALAGDILYFAVKTTPDDDYVISPREMMNGGVSLSKEDLDGLTDFTDFDTPQELTYEVLLSRNGERKTLLRSVLNVYAKIQ